MPGTHFATRLMGVPFLSVPKAVLELATIGYQSHALPTKLWDHFPNRDGAITGWGIIHVDHLINKGHMRLCGVWWVL